MQTCPLPGAKKIRALSAQLLHAKAQRKKVRANQPKVRRGGKAFKKLAAKRSSMYTGKRPKDNFKVKIRNMCIAYMWHLQFTGSEHAYGWHTYLRCNIDMQI